MNITLFTDCEIRLLLRRRTLALFIALKEQLEHFLGELPIKVGSIVRLHESVRCMTCLMLVAGSIIQVPVYVMQCEAFQIQSFPLGHYNTVPSALRRIDASAFEACTGFCALHYCTEYVNLAIDARRPRAERPAAWPPEPGRETLELSYPACW